MERVAIGITVSLLICVPIGATVRAAADAWAKRFGVTAAGRYGVLYAALCAVPIAWTVLFVRLLRGAEITADAGRAHIPAAVVADAVRSGAGITMFVAIAWVAGVSLLILRLLRQWLRTRTLTRPHGAEPSAALLQLAAEVASQMDVRVPAIGVTARVTVPAVVGVRNPIVLLPRDIDAIMTRPQLRLVLGHELAHIRRRDPVANILQAMIETLFFFSPAMRALSASIRAEREIACDALAAGILGEPLVLARALERLETMRGRRQQRFALAADDEPLLRRIRMLVQPARAARAQYDRALPAAAAIASIALLCTAAVPASLADDVARLHAPAATLEQNISAYDDAGPFTVAVVGYRAVGASFAGRPFPAERIRQRGNAVRFIADNGTTFLTVRLRPTGGMTWQSR